MNLKLIGNLVLLAPAWQPPKSDGGIHYAMRYRDDRKQWRVVGVGPGRKLKSGVVVPPEVRVGDRVLMEPDLGVKETFEDGSVIVDASQIIMRW